MWACMPGAIQVLVANQFPCALFIWFCRFILTWRFLFCGLFLRHYFLRLALCPPSLALFASQQYAC